MPGNVSLNILAIYILIRLYLCIVCIVLDITDTEQETGRERETQRVKLKEINEHIDTKTNCDTEMDLESSEINSDVCGQGLNPVL